MIKVLCIGHSSYDITVKVDEFPKENTKTRFINKIACGGGPAANAAYLLGKWGVSTTFAGVVGNDVFGNRIRKELESVGVDTRYMETSYENDTTISFIIANQKNGSRTSFNVADNYVGLKKYDFDYTPDVILVDGHDVLASRSTLERFPKALGIIDAGRYTEDISNLCKKVKYLVCSKEFAEKASNLLIDYNNPQTIVNVYDALMKKYENQEIVITLEDHGAVYKFGDDIKISPALDVKPVVDSTGAGDIFHGAFTYVIASGGNVEKAVKFGNIAAGLSLGTVGARLSIPKLDDVKKVYEKNLG